MTLFPILDSKRLVPALAVAAAALATSSVAAAKTHGAVTGTTADKIFGLWSSPALGGVQNDAAAARDWLMPIDLAQETCNSSISPCQVKATFRGGTNGASCVRGYFIDAFGAVLASIGPVCQGTAFATKSIGTGQGNYAALLIVANLASGGATHGAIDSVDIDDGSIDVARSSMAAMKGNGSNFDAVNWAEFGVGGIRNKSSSFRDWWVSVPNGSPDNIKGHVITARATFGGGAGGDSCVDVFGLDASGGMVASLSACRGTFGTTSLGQISGAHVIYDFILARASAQGANDGGVVSTVAY